MNPAALKAAMSGDLANALIASTPGGIEAQEAAGQAELVANGTKLPKEIRGATRAQLEALGFKFGADVDELFVSVTLPSGWRLKATEHSMHNDLLDANGSKRAGIFYKAAFYDRRADMCFDSRYYVHTEYSEDGTVRTVSVRDSATRADIRLFGTSVRGEYALWDEHTSAADAWLREQYPECRNALAYW
jgi:hypothetical protein